MTNLGSDLVERASNHGKGCQKIGVGISLNYLGRNGSSLQSQTGAHLLFQLRAEMSEGADCAGKLSDTNLFRRTLKAFDVALHFGVPVGQLKAKSHSFCVHSLTAPNHGRLLPLPSAASDYR